MSSLTVVSPILVQNQGQKKGRHRELAVLSDSESQTSSTSPPQKCFNSDAGRHRVSANRHLKMLSLVRSPKQDESYKHRCMLLAWKTCQWRSVLQLHPGTRIFSVSFPSAGNHAFDPDFCCMCAAAQVKGYPLLPEILH
jgi:hypothetical protein